MQLFRLGLWGLIFISFPSILFYLAFYSGNAGIKNSINNLVELYYLLFIFISVSVAYLSTRYWIYQKHLSSTLIIILLNLFKITVILYALFLLLNTMSRYLSYQSEALDVVYFQSELEKLSAFKIPAYAWSQHFSPILIFLVPFFWLSHSGGMLMFIQAVLVLSGAIPLYLAVFKQLKSQWLSLALVVSYLTFGGLQFGYAYGFHEIMFLPPLFFWAYYFMVTSKSGLYFTFLFLGLFVKEEVGFITVFWGLYLIFKKRFSLGLGTVAAGTLWLLLCFLVIFPYFNPNSGYNYWGQYPGGTGLIALTGFAFTHPLQFLTLLVTPLYKLHTIFHSFGQFSFISLLYPPALTFVLPSLLEKLLSSNIAAFNGFHYSSAITSVILVSTIESLVVTLKKTWLKDLVKYPAVFFGTVIVYTAVLANILYGYHPLSPLLINAEDRLTDTQLEFLNHAIKSIPKTASVAAQYYIRPHLGKPTGQTSDISSSMGTPDYVIANTNLPLVMSEQKNFAQDLLDIVNNEQYNIILYDSATVLFKRNGFLLPPSPPQLPHLHLLPLPPPFHN